MAPTDIASLFSKRATCQHVDYYGRCVSSWDIYGRWIFAAAIVVVMIIVFFMLACVNTRRRRKRGMQPMYGTGWMANNQQHTNNPQGYNNAYNSNTSAPPAYGTPQAYPMNDQQTGNKFNQGNGYYGDQGVTHPQYAHTGNNNQSGADYAPPTGPPPGKTNY